MLSEKLKFRKRAVAIATLNDEKLTKYVRLSTVLTTCTTFSKVEIRRKLRRDDYAAQLDELKKEFELLVEEGKNV